MTLLLIATNIAVFFAWQMRVGLPRSVTVAGLLPSELQPVSFRGAEHVFTSMFMHGGIAHLLLNMWFLWIFGDNVEDEIGRARFLLLYLLSGVGAAFAHVVINTHSVLPLVGASGAISGALGAYLVLHPGARVKVFFLIRFFQVPAWFYLLSWIALQVLAVSNIHQTAKAGIAYWAHIGGFAAGMLLSVFILPRQNPKNF